MFEDDVCVDLSGVLDMRPNYADGPFSGLFARPCADLPEVIDKWPDYEASPLLGFYVRARCPLMLASIRGVRLR